MSGAPRIGIPALAGLCSLQDATRIGFTVDDNVARLLRYHWTEKRLSEIAASRLTSTPEWEVKGAFALHQWLDSEHATALRERIREMRHPLPRLDVAPAGCEQVEALEHAETIEWLEQAVAAAPTGALGSDFTPRRDARFTGSSNFNFPPHNVYALPYVPADERNLALLCKRLLEMDVPEMMASFITEKS